jgi:hypothetical protein
VTLPVDVKPSGRTIDRVALHAEVKGEIPP